MTWQRARTEQQKEERVGEIVAATARLYERYTFEEITYLCIAAEANFTRSNLYKYFSTKEEIFLELLGQDFVHFRKSLARALRAGKVSSVSQCATVWARTLIKHERLLKLFSILYTSLERNASLESLTKFKKTAKEELTALAGLLSDIFPNLPPEKTVQFLHLHAALAIGLYPMGHLTERQKQAMEQAGFEHQCIDFPEHLRHGIESLLRDLVD